MKQLKVKPNRRKKEIVPEVEQQPALAIQRADTLPFAPEGAMEVTYPTQHDFHILKQQLRDPMIFDDPNISAMSPKAVATVMDDLELPLDEEVSGLNNRNHMYSNTFRALIQFDDEEPKAQNLVPAIGMFSVADDAEMWVKIGKPEGSQPDDVCYGQLPPMPMIFGNGYVASGVFVPFGVSTTGLHNAHLMLDAFCGPMRYCMEQVGISCSELYGYLSRSGIQYPLAKGVMVANGPMLQEGK